MTGTDEPLLEINDLSSGYDGVPIVRNVFLQINKRKILGIVVRNGVVKTTSV